jgi:DHA1 family tetracycline resistance protein-like MFS transporter
MDFAKPAPWRSSIEPWYISYGLLGVSVAGVLPILLPLAVSRHASVGEVGLVMAAFNLGGLVSPLWGTLADRYRVHRILLAFGVLSAAITIVMFAETDSVAIRAMLAFLQGAGSAAAATVANLFIVQLRPENEWERRIGWLQTFYGTGQVIGLILAGVLARISLTIGLVTTAGITACAFFPGWFLTPEPPRAIRQRPVLRHPIHHAELHAGSPQRFYHFPSLQTLRKTARTLISPFGLFVAAWLISFMGAAAFFSLYPILMGQAYGIGPATASGAFAVSAALGLALYPAAGKWSARFGADRVLRAGLLVRVLAFVGFLSLGLGNPGAADVLALICFLFVVLAWSLMSVGGTELASRLSLANEGEGLGVYNAATSLAGVLGAVAGGWLAGRFGYDAIHIFALVFTGLGLAVLSMMPGLRQRSPQVITPTLKGSDI